MAMIIRGFNGVGGDDGQFGAEIDRPMVNVCTAALLPEKSVIKNFRITKPYR